MSGFQTGAAAPLADHELSYYGPAERRRLLDFREVWRFRNLIWVFGLRDLKVRYRQTVVGVAWAVLQPLLTMLVFDTLFGFFGRKPAESAIPYAVSAYCGLLPWQLFSYTVTQSTSSLVVNQQLVTKVYFPRIILPISTVVSALVDFGVAFTLLVVMLAWHGVTPSAAVLCAPLLVGWLVLTALAVGIFLSAINARYRDVGYTVPFLLQLGLFVSPVVYETASVIPERWRVLYSLNPLVGILDGFRWSLLGSGELPWKSMLVSLAVVAAVLVGGLSYFRRVERTLVDRI